MSTTEKIKSRREELGIELKKVAADLRLSEPAYWDLEGYDDELPEVVDFSQAILLSRILRVELMALLEEHFDRSQNTPLSFENVHRLMTDRIESGSLDKDGLSWDMDKFLEAPSIAFEYPIAFLKLIGPEVGFDWRAVVAHYDEPRANDLL